MKVEIEIQTKPERDALGRKGDSSEAIFDLKEVQAIKYAIQEHFLFIGLDRNNNITNIRLIGVGNSSGINIDSKDIVRTALLTASEKVVLVHNHPSNKSTPSDEDIYLTNYTSKILGIFNITMIDHIIVTEKGYYSMGKYNQINRDFTNDKLNFVESTFIKEENIKLKEEIKILTNKIKKNKNRIER